MGAAIRLRDDFDGAALRSFAKASKGANQTRRLLALAAIFDGGKRSDAAEVGGVTLQIVRDWVLSFCVEGPAGPDRPQDTGPETETQCPARPGFGRASGTGPDPGDRRRGALAVQLGLELRHTRRLRVISIGACPWWDDRESPRRANSNRGTVKLSNQFWGHGN